MNNMEFYNWLRSREFWKHSAVANIPFNLEIMPTGNVRPDAIVKKIVIEDRLGNIVRELNGDSGRIYRDPKKGLVYYKDLIMEKPGIYFDYWTFLDVMGRETTIKGGFVLHNDKFIGYPAFKLAPVVKRIILSSPERITIIMTTSDPFLTIEDAVFTGDDPQKTIELDWWHEIGPKVFLFKFNEDLTKNSKIEARLSMTGFDNVKWSISELIRLGNIHR